MSSFFRKIDGEKGCSCKKALIPEQSCREKKKEQVLSFNLKI